MVEKTKVMNPTNHEAYVQRRRFAAIQKRYILNNLMDTGIDYNTLYKAALSHKLTPDFLWEKILKGRKFTSMKMKVQK